MKIFQSLTVALCALALASCGGNTQQQQVPVPAPQGEQPAAVQQAPVQAAPQPEAQQPAAQQPAAQAVPAQALPQAITTFLQQHFPNVAIAMVETDADHGGLEYDVTLTNGVEVDFDINNQWEQVDCRAQAVPAALVPAPIAAYVKANYQSMPITKIDNNHYGYEIRLVNGMELKFDASGRFLAYDD